jgi:uncharacterized protein YdhG (YjbR/CyaY superfamily)
MQSGYVIHMAAKNIDEYISTFPRDIQAILQNIRKTIREVAPGAEEVIGYGVPAFKLKGEYLAYFAAFKKHVGFYPLPSAIKRFEKELSDYETSEGTIKFPLDKPIPYSLIEKIVEFRVKEVI